MTKTYLTFLPPRKVGRKKRPANVETAETTERKVPSMWGPAAQGGDPSAQSIATIVGGRAYRRQGTFQWAMSADARSARARQVSMWLIVAAHLQESLCALVHALHSNGVKHQVKPFLLGAELVAQVLGKVDRVVVDHLVGAERVDERGGGRGAGGDDESAVRFGNL